MIEDLKHIIESLLFVSDTPLSVKRIRQILDLRRSDVIADALAQLNEEYETRKGGFYLAEAAGGYQLRSRPENKEWIRRLLQSGPARLSKAAMETLAIVAYKQPIIRSDVEYIRGVDCGGVLRVLLERKLVKILGRREIPGRPMIYGTTKKFLEIFSLRDLKDLPLPKEIMAPEDAAPPPENKDEEVRETPFETPENDTDIENSEDAEALLEIDGMLKSVKPPDAASFEIHGTEETAAAESPPRLKNDPTADAPNPEKTDSLQNEKENPETLNPAAPMIHPEKEEKK